MCPGRRRLKRSRLAVEKPRVPTSTDVITAGVYRLLSFMDAHSRFILHRELVLGGPGHGEHGSGDNVYLIRFHYLPPGAWDTPRWSDPRPTDTRKRS